MSTSTIQTIHFETFAGIFLGIGIAMAVYALIVLIRMFIR